MGFNLQYPSVDPFSDVPLGVQCTSLSAAGGVLVGSAEASGSSVPLVTAAVSATNGASWPGTLNLSKQGSFSATDGSNIVVLTIGVSNQASYSTDDGASWTTISMPIGGFFFLLSANGAFWVAGNVNSVALYNSTDGGHTWNPAAVQPRSPATVGKWTAMATDGTSMVIAGIDSSFNQICYLTHDNGATWAAITAPPTFPQPSAIHLSGSTIVTGDNGGGLFYSTDSGATWHTATCAGFAPDGPRAFVLARRILVMGLNTTTHDGMIALSSDGGATWALNPSQPFQGQICNSLVVSKNRLWAGGQDSTFAHTLAFANLAPPPIRQFPRDDRLAVGAVRQGPGRSSSLQSSVRQGWRGTYA